MPLRPRLPFLRLSLLALSACLPNRCSRGTTSEAPAIVANATLGDAPFLGGHRPVLTADGTLVVIESKAIAAFDATGTRRWQRSLRHGDWIVPLADGSLFLADEDRHELVAIDPAAGSDRWRVTIPIGPDPDSSDRSAEGAVRIADRVLVALADARFLRVNPTECASAPARCITTQFTLPDETISDPTLDALPNGDVILGESGQFRQLSPTGETRAAFHVRDGHGEIAVGTGNKLAVAMDDDLLLFDLARCAASKPVMLPRKANKLYVRGEGECDDCIAPPNGCVIAHPRLDDVDSMQPRILADGSVVVNTDDGVVRISVDGKKSWKSDVRFFGGVIEVGTDLVGIASTDDKILEKSHARVVGLDPATGKIRWTRDLPAKTAGFFISTDDILLTTAGPWLVAGYKTSASWLRLPNR